MARLTEVILFTEWRRMIVHGWVSQRLLMDWRTRLASGEFMTTTARDLMALEVSDALAAAIGCDPADLPGSPLADMPESSGDIPPGPGLM